MKHNITIKAKIEWSESAYVNAKMNKAEKDENGFVPVDVLNQILKVATWHLLYTKGPDCGYDKTKFNLIVIDHNDNDKVHEYTGRVDLGSDTETYSHVLNEHIIEWLEYCMSDKSDSFCKFSKEETLEALQWCIWMNHGMAQEVEKILQNI